MLSHYVKSLECIFDGLFKQDAAHEPECSHLEQFCETTSLNSLYMFRDYRISSLYRHCGMWKGAVCKVWSVKANDC